MNNDKAKQFIREEFEKPVEVNQCRKALKRLCDSHSNGRGPVSGPKPRISIPVSASDDDILLARALSQLEETREENEKLKEGLRKIQKLGYNQDCMFCGFKDKAVKEYLE